MTSFPAFFISTMGKNAEVVIFPKPYNFKITSFNIFNIYISVAKRNIICNKICVPFLTKIFIFLHFIWQNTNLYWKKSYI